MRVSPPRTLALVVSVAVLSTAAGYVAASHVSSPAEEAARAQPPPATAVTAPVERRTLTSQVVTRGDAVFGGALDVSVEESGLDTPAVVTGEPPAVGATITEGQAILEIAGRPVIALDGDLPTYRSLGPGSTGPDVAQLETALQRLGIDTGTVDDVYDTQTATGVAALYARVGYAPAAPPAEVQQRLEAARAEEAAASAQVGPADNALKLAQQGPKDSERLAADNAVNAAQRQLDEATAGGDGAAIADATDQLALAKAQRKELLAPHDATMEKAAATQAHERLDQAGAELQAATVAAGTPLPAAEVMFISTLPRRVDVVHVTRGKVVDGPVMSVSGATLIVQAKLDSADRALVKVGMPTKQSAGATTIDGTITKLDDDQTTGSSVATIELTAPTPEQLDAIRGQNVKVTVPIASSGGAVLAVPLAALTAGSGGEVRVERQQADGSTQLIEVTVGLTADGFAQIEAKDGQLSEGDLVVVGR